ncbi:MAG: exodeoxyribonuclease VII small subunit [Acidimicrobiales bacterium]|nr:exodeoxyribonuclease VII small subunit [Acidimicrobiales bacterium]
MAEHDATGPGAPAPEAPQLEEPAGYAAALAELDDILAELEDPQLDIDRLGGQVRRAAQLIAFCKQRIVGARLEVEAITNGEDGG